MNLPAQKRERDEQLAGLTFWEWKECRVTVQAGVARQRTKDVSVFFPTVIPHCSPDALPVFFFRAAVLLSFNLEWEVRLQCDSYTNGCNL